MEPQKPISNLNLTSHFQVNPHKWHLVICHSCFQGLLIAIIIFQQVSIFQAIVYSFAAICTTKLFFTAIYTKSRSKIERSAWYCSIKHYVMIVICLKMGDKLSVTLLSETFHNEKQESDKTTVEKSFKPLLSQLSAAAVAIEPCPLASSASSSSNEKEFESSSIYTYASHWLTKLLTNSRERNKKKNEWAIIVLLKKTKVLLHGEPGWSFRTKPFRLG